MTELFNQLQSLDSAILTMTPEGYLFYIAETCKQNAHYLKFVNSRKFKQSYMTKKENQLTPIPFPT